MFTLLAGLRFLAGQILPLVEKAKGLMGGDMSSMFAAVKGAKPMDLLALGAMQILPQVAPTIGALAQAKMAQWGFFRQG